MVVRRSPTLRQAGSPALAPKRRLPPRTRPHLEQRLLLTVLLIPLWFTSLTAQDRAGDGLARIEVGSRVRVTAPAIYEGRLVGHVIAFIPDTLLIEQKLFTRWKVPEADIELIEVSLERKSRAGTGALIGAGTIAAAGVGTALVGCADSDCTLFFYAALGATLVGAGIGALIGSQIRVDRWEEVPLDRISVSLRPRGGGLEVSAKFVF